MDKTIREEFKSLVTNLYYELIKNETDGDLEKVKNTAPITYVDDAINNTFEVIKDEVYIANPWVYQMTASWAAYNYLWDNEEDTETSYGFAWTVTMLCRDLIIEDKFFDITEIFTDWKRM